MRVMRTLVGLVAAAAAATIPGLALVASASAAGPVAFVGQESLKVSARAGVATATVAVSNEGPGATIAWSVTLTSAAGAAQVDVDPASSSLSANGVSVVDLTFRVTGAEGSLAGYLIGTVDGGSAPAVLPLTIQTFPFEVPFGQGLVIVVSVVVAAVWVFLCWRWGGLRDLATNVDPNAPPAWEPTSWATTITGAGGLLALLTLSGALPADTVLFSRQEFAALALVFAALGVLAPLAFVALRDWCGTAPMTAVAMALTTAGVLGQLTTLDLLIVDAYGQSGGPVPLLVFLAIAILCGVLVLLYVWRSLATILPKGAAVTGGRRVTLPLL